MEPIEQCSYILPTVSAVVDRIRPDQLDLPTPCATFRVHDLLDHMIVLGGTFAYWFRGEEPAGVGPSPRNGVVPTAEFRKVMDDLLDAIRSPGALARTITAPVGEMPGETFARLVAVDGLVHGWDLATATGARFELPPAAIAAVDTFARAAIGDDLRDGDTFADPTTPSADATQLERLAAFTGRTVRAA